MYTLHFIQSYTLFGTLQNPNHWELGLQICISYSNMYVVWCVKTILWYLQWSWRNSTFTRWGSGLSAQVLQNIKSISEKIICKRLTYFVFLFWIIMIHSELLIYQKDWDKIQLTMACKSCRMASGSHFFMMAVFTNTVMAVYDFISKFFFCHCLTCPKTA